VKTSPKTQFLLPPKTDIKQSKDSISSKHSSQYITERSNNHTSSHRSLSSAIILKLSNSEQILKTVTQQYNVMTDVVYAIRISNLEYTGLKIMDVKIGKSTNIENTLSQYSRGNRNIKLLDMWTPNPDKTLSTAEKGVHRVAEKYAYSKQSEKFVFLQSGYQEFADTINKILKNTGREELSTETETSEQAEGRSDFTGTTPSVIKILGETLGVKNWTDTLTKAVTEILAEAEDQEKITEIQGRKRSYFVKEDRQSDLVAPRKIPDTEIYVETNFSANDVVRIIEKVLDKYGYNKSQFEVYTEEEN